MNATGLATSFVCFAVAFAASLFGVALFTRISLRRGFLDVPNERSSHSAPTPRGAGLIIVLVSLAGYVIGGIALGLHLSWGYVAGAVLVATVSWLDDLYSLPFWSRLIFHIVAACLLIFDAGYFLQISVPLTSIEITLGSVVGVFVTIVWLVWFLNSYNFMDGIDGIAATQAVISCIAWAVLASVLHLDSVYFFAGILASASAGFLMHNWSPATVFMGDVGSAFLGFTLAAFPLLAEKESGLSSTLPIVGLLFVWFFIFDTVFTLARRAFARKRIWEAHREHIYQKLVIEGRQHSSVTLFYGLASALVSSFVILSLTFSGIYSSLALLSLVILTICLTYLGVRKYVDVKN